MVTDQDASEGMDLCPESTDRMVVESDEFFALDNPDALDGAGNFSSARTDFGVVDRVRSGTSTWEEDALQHRHRSRPEAVVLDTPHTVTFADVAAECVVREVDAEAAVSAPQPNMWFSTAL